MYLNLANPTYLNSVVQYKCMQNFRMIGSSNRTCLQTGKWSGEAPKCEGK